MHVPITPVPIKWVPFTDTGLNHGPAVEVNGMTLDVLEGPTEVNSNPK